MYKNNRQVNFLFIYFNFWNFDLFYFIFISKTYAVKDISFFLQGII